MRLGQFRELTKDLPDDVEIIIDAKYNPCGNCWDVLCIEATSLSFFGVASPAIKLSQEDPEYVDENSEEVFHINPEDGQWLKK